MSMQNRSESVRRVHSTHTPDDEGTRVCVATHLAEVFRYRALAPNVVDGELARYGLLTRAQARALDTSLPTPKGSSAHDPFSDFVDGIIADADTTGDLIRMSGTCPRERDLDVLPLARELVSKVSTFGSAWLVRDLRRKRRIGGEHFHGIVTCPNGMQSDLKRTWIEISGCNPKCVNTITITGWSPDSTKRISGAKAYTTTGDATELRLNLIGDPERDRFGVISYALKPLPRGPARDLDRDVVACGWLADAWRAFRDGGAPSGHPTSANAFAPGESVTRACAACGRDISHMRPNAKTCKGGKCRSRKFRRDHTR